MLSLVFVIAAMVFAVGGTVRYSEAAAANTGGIVVTGTVTAVTEERRWVNRHSKRYSVAQVGFVTAEGETRSVEFSRTDAVGDNAYEVGEQFQLVYSADDPSHVVLAGNAGFIEAWVSWIIGGILAVLALVVGVVGVLRLRGPRLVGRPAPLTAG